MAQQRMAPDAILVQTNLSGAVSAIQDDPDSPDANWLTAPGSNNDTVCRVSFGTPTNPPTIGAGLQNFRVQVRKTNHSTDPTAVVELYENGSLIAEIVASTTITSTTGQILAGSWNASSLGVSNGSGVECRVVGTTGGGNPGNRASVEVGAIEWNAETSPAAQNANAQAASFATNAPSATVTPGGVQVATIAASVAFDAPAPSVQPGPVSIAAQAASFAWDAPDAAVSLVGELTADAEAASLAYDAPAASVQPGEVQVGAAAATFAWDAPDAIVLPWEVMVDAAAATFAYDAPMASVFLGSLFAPAEAASFVFDAPSPTVVTGPVSTQAQLATFLWDAPAAGAVLDNGNGNNLAAPSGCSAGIDLLN